MAEQRSGRPDRVLLIHQRRRGAGAVVRGSRLAMVTGQVQA